MSLREQWYNARMERQQQVRERQQQVVNFLQEVRYRHQEAWLEQKQQRVAYVTAIKNYVWGTGSESENIHQAGNESGQYTNIQP